MRSRLLIITVGAVALVFSACKKEFVEGDIILVNDTVTATNATTLSFTHTWDDTLYIVDAASALSLSDTMGGLRIPFALQQGDRLVATLHVGLSVLSSTGGPCFDSLYLSMGSIFGGDFDITPTSPGVLSFDGGFNAGDQWQGQWTRTFTRQQELTLQSDAPTGVVQTFAKLRALNAGCAPGTAAVYVMSRSLTLTVLRP